MRNSNARRPQLLLLLLLPPKQVNPAWLTRQAQVPLPHPKPKPISNPNRSRRPFAMPNLDACALTARRATHSENFPLQLITNLMCAAPDRRSEIAGSTLGRDRGAFYRFGQRAPQPHLEQQLPEVQRGGGIVYQTSVNDDIDATSSSTLDAVSPLLLRLLLLPAPSID